jgi:ABC-type nitrate/sulfonate/bicarbonate transport system permease component
LKIINAIAPYAFSALIWLACVLIANLILGAALAPDPIAIFKSLFALIYSTELFRELGLTIWRGLVGVFFANIVGIILGVLAGKITILLRFTAPLVAGLQSCPPIVWISLVMVWAGTGSLVPIATVFAATVPFVFSNTAQGVMGLPARVLSMSRLYEVPFWRVFTKVTLPGILPYWLAGLSTVLATSWKAAAVAEFMGSQDGAGARIYWCYSHLNLEDLNVWALSLIVLGILLEGLFITPLRKKAAQMAAQGEACI